MKKLLSSFVLSALGLVAVNAVASACDKPSKTTVTVISHRQVADCDEAKAIIGRLEKLLEPVADKVHDCNEELEAAEARVQELETDLSHAETEMSKGMRTLLAFKAALADKSCTLCIGGKSFRRETVAKAMSVQLENYKTIASKVTALSTALAEQKQEAQAIAVRVALWVEAEQKLLSEVSQLQTQHASYFSTNNAKAVAGETADATRLAIEVEKMLTNAESSSAVDQILVEVDEVISADIK